MRTYHSYFWIGFFMLLCIHGNAQTEEKAREIFEQGNASYNKKDYTAAIEAYRSIEEEGFYSSGLYHNLGNAYFRQGDYAHAILAYERALRLSPKNKDIKHNLEVTRARIVDQFDVLPEFFLYSGVKNFAYLLPSIAWTMGIILFWAICLLFTAKYLTAKTYSRKKVYFRLAIIFLFLGILSFTNAYVYRELEERKEGVVMVVNANVKTAPDTESKTKFIIHQGCKIRLEDQIDSYYKIQTEDGNTGWLADSEFEKI